MTLHFTILRMILILSLKYLLCYILIKILHSSFMSTTLNSYGFSWSVLLKKVYFSIFPFTLQINLFLYTSASFILTQRDILCSGVFDITILGLNSICSYPLSYLRIFFVFGINETLYQLSIPFFFRGKLLHWAKKLLCWPLLHLVLLNDHEFLFQ